MLSFYFKAKAKSPFSGTFVEVLAPSMEDAATGVTKVYGDSFDTNGFEAEDFFNPDENGKVERTGLTKLGAVENREGKWRVVAV